MDFRPELSWEFWSADQIAARTLRALRNHVQHVKEGSPWYSETLSHVYPADINTLDDFYALPFTDKTDLAQNTERFRAVLPEHILETVVTSGSTGKPVVFGLTAPDLDRLAFNEAMAFHSIGVSAHDHALLMVSMDRLFIAGMAYYRGLIMLGANTSRMGVAPVEMQKQFIGLLKPTVVVGVPSVLYKLGKQLQTSGLDTRASSIKKIMCIGESLRNQDMQFNAVANGLQEMFDAQVFSTYAATEISTAYCDCAAQAGGHARPELIYTEIVDEAGKQVPDGTPGELVVTPLGIEGMPLIRYKTGDITFKISTPCSCGRNSIRIGPVLSRKSQMIKIKGTTVYPLAITNALDELDFVNDYVIVLEGDIASSDQVTIQIAAPAQKLEIISRQIQAAARVHFPVLISNTTTIAALRGQSHKTIRVIDNRKRLK